ncbi:glycosyltransferase 87 family protein [Streptomyces sp. NPDC005551]|uniref:glycosyltransferase 87 family protein n=1 Tax=Streptomyces sp. NPDC005551 TaxID=3364725 RepID=UPI0036C093AD
MTPTALPRDRRALLALGTCLLSFTVFWTVQRTAHVSMIDLMVYRAEGETVRGGGDLYALRATGAGLPATYPPFAALLFVPLALLGAGTARTLATAGNLVLLVAFAGLASRLVGHARVEGVWWVAAAAVWCEPVWTTLRYGQINLLIAVLVLWDLTRRPGHRWAGAGIGLAAAIKLTPALFAVFLLVAGVVARTGGRCGEPWLRHARGAAVVFAGATLSAAAVLPYDSWRFWTRVVFEAERAGLAEDTANQSLRGMLARLLHTPDPGLWWIAAATAVGAAGLAASAAAELRGSRPWAAVGCATTALLVSPVSWSHHWVWCVPMAMVLATRNRTAAVGAALVFCSYALWWVPHGSGRHELRQGGVELTLSALYGVTALFFLALTAARTGRAGTGTAGTGTARPGEARLGEARSGEARPRRRSQAVANE